ncbi:MAG: galactokinase, partial [Cyclobacteriaceae bacterium]
LTITESIRYLFNENFKGDPVLVSSPGRINVIGEHTDYNMGFVLPAAIDKSIYIAVGLSENQQCRLIANDLNEDHTFYMDDLKKTGSWPDYIIGVFREIAGNITSPRGFNMVISGDVPLGAGLSSSAALECAAGLALSHIYGLNLGKLEIARIGLKAERSFVGLDCGIMDQYASVFGKEDNVLLIDCQNETHRHINLHLGDQELLLVNSHVTHQLAADSAYNERRTQCMEGVRMVNQVYSHVRSLREVSMDMLDKVSESMEDIIYRRCAYVIRENARVLEVTDLLESRELTKAGAILFEAHDDMKRNYEVTCKETDFLVQLARDTGFVMGARQMGGGFGGCTINLLPTDKLDEFREFTDRKYNDAFGISPEFIEISISDGASLIS